MRHQAQSDDTDGQLLHALGSIMTANAAVVSTKLVELFDTVPDYLDYECEEAVRDTESDYRVALGRVAKAWGDQLLDLAEHPPSPLTRNERRTIDTLLNLIGQVFRELNSFQDTYLPPGDRRRRLRLRRSDGAILRCVEQSVRVMDALQTRDGPALWLHGNASGMYRRLRRLTRELHRRNELLAAAEADHCEIGDDDDVTGGILPWTGGQR